MDSRSARVARGFAAASFATFVAAFSHVTAGGSPPTLFAVLVSLVISSMLATLLAGRAVSGLRLAVSIGLSQVLFHSLFSSLGAPMLASHDHDAALVTEVVSHAHSTMWLAHCVAGLITIVAFRYAELAFWGLLATARLQLTRLLGLAFVVLVPVRRADLPGEAVFVARLARTVLSSLRYRGPPVEFAV